VGVGALAEPPVIVDGAVGGGVLDQRAEHLAAEGEGSVVTDRDRDAPCASAGADHVDRLGMAVFRDEIHLPSRFPGRPVAHRHRLGGRGAFVQKGCIGDLQPCEVDHNRLEVEQGLEATLGDLGLVRRVRRVPARVLEDVSLDDRRGEGVVVAHSNEGAEDLIPRSEPADLGKGVALVHRTADPERLAETDRGRYRRLDELVERRIPEQGNHLRDVVLARTDVARDEPVLAEPGFPNRGRQVMFLGAVVVAGPDRAGPAGSGITAVGASVASGARGGRVAPGASRDNLTPVGPDRVGT
jgi:hypothetical protein